MFIPIRINWRVLNLVTIIQSGYITWQHGVSSHFIYYSIAQGNSEECLSIVLPGMFGSQGECVLSVRESVLFLMLYKPLRAQGPSQHTNTASRASDRTQRAVHLHKHCSVPFSTTHSMRQIQSDSPSVYTITGTAWMFREQSLERVPSAFVVAVRACQEGPVMPSGRRAHGAVTPNNGMSQLSAALSQFTGMTVVEQPGPAVSHSRSWALQHLRERSRAADATSGSRSHKALPQLLCRRGRLVAFTELSENLSPL